MAVDIVELDAHHSGCKVDETKVSEESHNLEANALQELKTVNIFWQARGQTKRLGDIHVIAIRFPPSPSRQSMSTSKIEMEHLLSTHHIRTDMLLLITQPSIHLTKRNEPSIVS